MEQIETGKFVPAGVCSPPDMLRVISWNINRGLQLSGIIEFLSEASADLILLQEADVNARRTQYRNIAREIAQALRMNYVFGREFEELTQGNNSSTAYHGQATLSKLPILSSRILRFGRQATTGRQDGARKSRHMVRKAAAGVQPSLGKPRERPPSIQSIS
jgi:endonuclease/exonuclease/phosphatase family metal-dependent hydrolase